MFLGQSSKQHLLSQDFCNGLTHSQKLEASRIRAASEIISSETVKTGIVISLSVAFSPIFSTYYVKVIIAQIPAVCGNPCTECGTYKERAALKHWVTPDALRHRRQQWLRRVEMKLADFAFACSHALAVAIGRLR